MPLMDEADVHPATGGAAGEGPAAPGRMAASRSPVRGHDLGVAEPPSRRSEAGSDPISLRAIADDVLGVRRAVVVAAGAASFVSLIAAVILVGVGVGGVVLLGLAPSLPGQLIGVGVALGATAVLSPWIALMLTGSAWYHRRVGQVLRELGVERPAQGFRAALRLLRGPLLLTVALLTLSALLILVWPEPTLGRPVELLLAIAVLLTPLIAPLPGVWWARMRATDRAATTALRHGGLVSLHLYLGNDAHGSSTDVQPFPLIAGRPRPVVRADLLRLRGELERAETLLRMYLARVGLSPVSALHALSRIHCDAGRFDEAEQTAAGAARVFAPSLRSWVILAEIQLARGRPDRALDALELADELRVAFFGVGSGARTRSRLAAIHDAAVEGAPAPDVG